mmetsp:Transcript_17886/g.43430  ORF Transcript_17886/g.43430 Transcript_17886/m.43430 type:complete len:114 (-) Transcript_17886:675-1016(-)
MDSINQYEPGDAVVIGFDDAAAADAALVGEEEQRMTLPTQSESEESSDEEEEDVRPVVGPANNLSQFERGTQQEAPRPPPPLTQRTNDAAASLLGRQDSTRLCQLSSSQRSDL